MKRIIKTLAILSLGILVAGCSKGFDPAPENMDGIAFKLKIEGQDMLQTKSMVSGTENKVTSMQIVCFDQYGLYLGTRNIKVTGNTLDGYAPTGTTRIHFVANRDLTVPLPFTAGTSEKAIMNSETLSTAYNDTDNQEVIYWGYYRTEDPDAMVSWLQKGIPQGGTPNTVYLIRDRARIRLNITADLTGKTVSWLIHNGRDRGYIAPYDATKDNPWADYYKEKGDKKVVQAAFHEYENSGRYSLWNSSTDNQDENFDKYVAGSDNYQYVFDDLNKSTDPEGRIKLILKVTSGSTPSTPKYLVVLLKNANNEQIAITRNNTYVVNVSSLDHDGYGTLEKAVNGSEFANSAAEAERTIPVINDDTYSLQIDLDEEPGKTSVVYNSTGTYNIGFKFLQLSDMSNATTNPADFEFSWEDNKQATWTIGTADYNSSEGKWYVPVTLGYVGSDAPVSDYLIVKHKASGLVRYVHIYAVASFKADAPKLVKESVQFEGRDVYKLTISIPSNFAEDLYPLEIRFATATLDAFSDNSASSRNGSFGVEIKSTENLTSSTTATDWNYAAKDWGYWYVYTVDGRPSDGKVTIYFKDIRDKKEQTKPNSLGLFLEIPNFGGVKTLTPAS